MPGGLREVAKIKLDRSRAERKPAPYSRKLFRVTTVKFQLGVPMAIPTSRAMGQSAGDDPEDALKVHVRATQAGTSRSRVALLSKDQAPHPRCELPQTTWCKRTVTVGLNREVR